MTGVKAAVSSIALGVVMMPTMQGLEIGSLILIFACFLIGSIIGAYYALREQLKRKKQAAIPPSTVEP